MRPDHDGCCEARGRCSAGRRGAGDVVVGLTAMAWGGVFSLLGRSDGLRRWDRRCADLGLR